jgi:lipopolysaccharide transport system ATP-binding protein
VNELILVKGVSKVYKQYPSKWARVKELLSGGRWETHTPRWALRGIDFSVTSGQSVGIVGQNGAGKSTLLKILTGTTCASSGTIQIRGRVAALLELGMGFQPDFSGRANAILTCRMMGLEKGHVDRLMPGIEAFAELGHYMDQPMRIYSTGMHVRLAFSAATAVRPEILIVDEALSVGDAYFQHKCIRRIRQFQEEGTTLLFVSHDLAAVKSLCSHAILLDEGRLLKQGSPVSVLDYYNSLVARKTTGEPIHQHKSDDIVCTRSGSGEVRIQKAFLRNHSQQEASVFSVGDTAYIDCTLEFQEAMETPTVGFKIRDRLGNEIFGTSTWHHGIQPVRCHLGDLLQVRFKVAMNLGLGDYAISLAVHTGDSHLAGCHDWWDQCKVFQMVPGAMPYFIGVAAMPVEVSLELQEGSP